MLIISFCVVGQNNDYKSLGLECSLLQGIRQGLVANDIRLGQDDGVRHRSST